MHATACIEAVWIEAKACLRACLWACSRAASRACSRRVWADAMILAKPKPKPPQFIAHVHDTCASVLNKRGEVVANLGHSPFGCFRAVDECVITRFDVCSQRSVFTGA
jgi:hypothetical protein